MRDYWGEREGLAVSMNEAEGAHHPHHRRGAGVPLDQFGRQCLEEVWMMEMSKRLPLLPIETLNPWLRSNFWRPARIATMVSNILKARCF